MTIIDTHSCTVPGLGVGAFHKHQVVHAGPLVCHVGVPYRRGSGSPTMTRRRVSDRDVVASSGGCSTFSSACSPSYPT